MSEKKPILNTVKYLQGPWWEENSDAIDRRYVPPFQLFRELLLQGPKYEAVLINGAGGGKSRAAAFLAAGLLNRLSSGPSVVISECTWRRGVSPLDRAVSLAGLRVVDSGRTHYGVLSTAELELFPKNWGVSPDRTHFTSYYYTLKPADLEQERSETGGVFSGGDPMRDFDTLIQAAQSLPGVKFQIAARDIKKSLLKDLPVNIQAGAVEHSAFMASLRGAKVAVFPFLKDSDRSAGQQSYLNAMMLGKLVIATDSPGVIDYIRDGQTGIIIPPADVRALVEAIEWAYNPSNHQEIQAITQMASKEVPERFSPLNYSANVFKVVQQTIADRGGRVVVGQLDLHP